MATEIIETEHETIIVDGIECYKDNNGNWVSRHPLSSSQSLAFSNYVRAKESPVKSEPDVLR